MVLNLPKITEATNIFKNSPTKNQVLKNQGGRNIPKDDIDTDVDTQPFLVDEDFTNLDDWTETNTGTGSDTAVSAGVATLSSGTTDDKYTQIVHSTNLGKISEFGSITLECRARGNYSAASKQEWGIGFWKNTGNDPMNNGQDWVFGGYDLTETGDEWNVFIDDSGGGGGAGSATYVDNTWHTLAVTVYGTGQVKLFVDGVQKLSDTGNSPPDDVDLYVTAYSGVRAAGAAQQTLEIDWIRVYYGTFGT